MRGAGGGVCYRVNELHRESNHPQILRFLTKAAASLPNTYGVEKGLFTKGIQPRLANPSLDAFGNSQALRRASLAVQSQDMVLGRRGGNGQTSDLQDWQPLESQLGVLHAKEKVQDEVKCIEQALVTFYPVRGKSQELVGRIAYQGTASSPSSGYALIYAYGG